MKSNAFLILSILVLILLAPACTRELASGDETAEQPWEFDHIPALAGNSQQNAGQTSAGQPEVNGEGIPILTGDEGDAAIEALMNGGRAALMNADMELALEYFNEVIVHDENHTKGLYNLGYTYRLIGDFERAVEFSRRAVESNPDELYVHQNLGFALEEQGKTDEAVVEFEEELHRHPDEPNLAGIAQRLAVIYLDKGLNQEAFDAAMHAVRLRPEMASAYQTLAMVHFSNGAWEQAIESLQKAIELEPEAGVCHKSLGDAFWAANRTDEAREAYAEAIRLNPELVSEIDPERLPQPANGEDEVASDIPL